MKLLQFESEQVFESACTRSDNLGARVLALQILCFLGSSNDSLRDRCADHVLAFALVEGPSELGPLSLDAIRALAGKMYGPESLSRKRRLRDLDDELAAALEARICSALPALGARAS